MRAGVAICNNGGVNSGPVQEPPAAESPLLKQKNVVLSAHLAGPIWDTQYQKFRNAFDNIQRVERGERPLWLIAELQQCKLRIDCA
jgi:phosphoglycerate dehydrogenase-like enzyme